MKAFPLFFLILIVVSACNKQKSKIYREEKPDVEQQNTTIKSRIEVIPMPQKTAFKIGEKVIFNLKPENDCPSVDSVVLSVAGKKFMLEYSTSMASWEISGVKTGSNSIVLSMYFHDGTKEEKKFLFTIFAANPPKEYTFKVLDTYKHDADAYTQGLVYEPDVLYESTGRQGKSSLRKVNYKTGAILQSTNLPSNVFGEGIAIIKDKIYQLTWQSNLGYVYDKATFKKIREFTYSTEGWGLATDGTSLILSDGTNILYWIDPEYFSVTQRLEVYDDKQKIDYINELEYINGTIWANIYGRSFVVIIDPATGEVTGKVDFSSLVPDGFEGNYEKVLNGIAFHNQKGSLFITGKLWPVLYEVKITEK